MQPSAPSPVLPSFRVAQCALFLPGECSISTHRDWLRSGTAAQVTYDRAVVLAALTFVKELRSSKGRALAPEGSQLAAAGGDPMAQVSPQNLAERVLHVFAENNIPVHQPFALPGLRLQLDCPGKPQTSNPHNMVERETQCFVAWQTGRLLLMMS